MPLVNFRIFHFKSSFQFNLCKYEEILKILLYLFHLFAQKFLIYNSERRLLLTPTHFISPNSYPMDKKIYNLMTKENPSQSETLEISQFMSTTFFKSLVTPLPINKIIPNLELRQWSSQTVIFEESEKIDSYYFLLEGSVNFYKKINISDSQGSRLEIIKNVTGPSLISDSLFSHATQRTYTAIANDSGISCKGFTLAKSIFEQNCPHLIKEYKVLKSYFCSFLNLSSDRFYKIDLYQNVQLKTFTYGQNIDTRNQIFIIYSGQCLMSFQQRSQRKQRLSIPYKLKIKRSKIFRPLLKLCQNQGFGMEKLFPQKVKATLKNFSYIVKSQTMVCICISIGNLGLFPKQILQKFKVIHQSHLSKLEENIIFLKLHKDSQQIQENSHQLSNSLSPAFRERSLTKRYEKNELFDSPCATIKPKFIQIPTHNKTQTQASPCRKGKSRFRLPNLKGTQDKQGQSIILQRSNISQSLNYEASPLKNSHITHNDINELRKMFCLGFELKNKCDKQSIHFAKKKKQKQILKGPKGYFPFGKNRKRDKQNSDSFVQQIGRKNSSGKHKQWSYYLKLPKISLNISSNFQNIEK